MHRNRRPHLGGGDYLPNGTFGVMEFQLMLLRRMADYQPSLVEEAVRSLGVPRISVAAAHRRWQARLRSQNFPQGSDRHRLILGDPETAFVRRFGAVTSQVAQWPMPLWPDLRFETIAIPGGPVLQEWLVRADPATRPSLERPPTRARGNASSPTSITPSPKSSTRMATRRAGGTPCSQTRAAAGSLGGTWPGSSGVSCRP